MRIVSLSPSATEIVCALGLRGALVGISHECDWPESVAGLPRVTGTSIEQAATSAAIDAAVRECVSTQASLYTLDEVTIARLRPDMIVTQTLCGVCAISESDVRDIASRIDGQPEIVSLEPSTLEHVLESIRIVGRAAGVSDRADVVVGELRNRIDAVSRRTEAEHRPRVAMLEWIDPPFSSGHWNPELVRLAGGVEGIGREGQPSRRIDWNEILEVEPEVLIVACCGFDAERTLAELPILERRSGWTDLPCVRAGRVHTLDGSAYFNRPGPRLVDSLETLAGLIQPERNARRQPTSMPHGVDSETVD